MKLSSFGKLLTPTYTDKLSINRYTEIENADGTIGIGLPETPLYSDVQCRISFKNSDNPESNKDDSNPIYLPILLLEVTNQMAKIYFDLIQVGLWEIENVPIRWRSDVQAMLDEE